ncbi:MAG TPA: hypothetical protein PKY56_13440, partial [Candidatus Kapabacteria bacterium]|nr:hypothetical protein [Candidatus Kapabacteria bacterium]
FNLNNPGVVTSIQDQSALVDPFAGAWANGVWYAGVGTDLITFNTTTGARTIIGSMGRTMNGMAYDITTNTMFGVANEGGVGNLYSINLTNGVTSLVGSNGAGIVFINLACDNNGQLYSIDIATDAFYSINKTTAAVTLIGPLGYDFNYIQDMEFDLINNVCYAAAVFNENGWKCDLLTIDIETGVASLYANFPNRNLEVSAFAIPFTPECLAFPHLFEPLNKSVQVVTSPTFLWLDVANAITYSIQIATDANFTNIAFEENGITGTSFNLPIGSELEFVTQYWWRIKAHGEGNCNSYWSNKWTFTTEGNVVPPVLISPTDNATGVFSYPTLTWVPSPGAVYYHIQIATDEYFNDLVYDTENIPTSQFFARALELENTYYWRVMGYNSVVYSDWSEEWTFTTTATNPVFGYNANGAGGIYEGPVVFELTNPSNMYSLQNQADLNFVRAGTWANDVWYGSVYDGTNGNLISINKATGDRTNIGALNLNVSGMSYDVTTETLYAVVLTDVGTSLYSINLTNGSATLVGACDERTFINLSCDINGDLYAIDLGDDIFYFIDKYTAIPTAIGPTGFDANYAQDMEFDKENNICYWAGYTTLGRLFTIDITTGAATLVSNFPGGMELTGFAIPFD